MLTFRNVAETLLGTYLGNAPALVTKTSSIKPWIANRNTHSSIFWQLKPDNHQGRSEANRILASLRLPRKQPPLLQRETR